MTIHIFIIVAFAFIICVEAILFITRRSFKRRIQKQLQLAKQEAQEIAQLPLNNPYPLIQINQGGGIIFANLAAMKSFPELKTMPDHPVIRDIISVGIREIMYGDKFYHQTISETKMSGETTFIIYCYDITDQKQHEQKLQTAYQETEKARVEAEHAMNARGDFLANMSHELRTPMNGIIGLSDILVDSNLSGHVRELITAVNSSAKNLLILLNDILDFSKIEAGELSIERINFDIRQLIGQLESLQTPIASEKGLYFETDIADSVPHYLMADPTRIQQILNNLASNALKFTNEGGVTISINTAPTGKKTYDLTITVSDTGIGIPHDKQLSIFDKFQQADTSTARNYGGTGLGLSITRQLTELMGGVISLESQESIGSQFIITLPVEEGHEDNPNNDDQLQQLQPTGFNLNAKILIVDDHPINVMVLKNVLLRQGFQNVTEAANGKEAVNYCQNTHYDLIFMDCQMPDMDGYEATKTILSFYQEKQPAPIIIAITADAMKGVEEKCKQAGMHDYISKPFEKDTLYALLKKWVSGDDTVTDQTTGDVSIQQSDDSDSVFDTQRLNEFTDGDPELNHQIKTVFINNLKDDMAVLETLITDKNYEEWDACVHKIYGSCAHLGVTTLASLCKKGQMLYPDNISDIGAQHKLIMREYASIYKSLKGYLTDQI